MSGCNVTFSINYIIFSFCDSSEENIVANSYTSLTLSVYYTHFLHHCTALLSLVYIFSKHELLKAISMRSLFVFHYSHFAGLKFCNVDWVYWRLSVSNIYEFTTYSIFSTELIDKILSTLFSLSGKSSYVSAPTPTPPADGSYYNMSDRYLSYPPPLDFQSPPPVPTHPHMSTHSHHAPITPPLPANGSLLRQQRTVVPPPDVLHNTNQSSQILQAQSLSQKRELTSFGNGYGVNEQEGHLVWDGVEILYVL